ncbi:MAG: hypothetical protein RJA70_821, partial [Pseudomonadota bacterium]
EITTQKMGGLCRLVFIVGCTETEKDQGGRRGNQCEADPTRKPNSAVYSNNQGETCKSKSEVHSYANGDADRILLCQLNQSTIPGCQESSKQGEHCPAGENELQQPNCNRTSYRFNRLDLNISVRRVIRVGLHTIERTWFPSMACALDSPP